MTITRVQQVTAVLTGTSDTVTLPSGPTYGNTLIAVLARADSDPVATSLTQTNVTWASIASGSNSDEVAHELFLAQNVGPGAGDAITVTRSSSDDYAIAVFEYAGLLKVGTLPDATTGQDGSGQAPHTGAAPTTAQADELFLATFAHTYLFRLLDDTLNSDQGYWRLDTSLGSTLTFAGGTAQVHGVAYAEPSGAASWENYRIAADVSGTSPGAGSLGWFGFGIYGSGEYLLPTANGYGGLINTLDNTVYALKAVNGVLTFNSYPYSGTLVGGQVYRLELRARTLTTGDVLLKFYVDGVLQYTEVQSGGATSGAPALTDSGSTPAVSTFNNLLVTGLDDTLVTQDTPSNSFTEITQSDATDLTDSRVVLGVFEKVVDAIDAPNTVVQTDEYVVWTSRLQTFFADLSAEYTRGATLDTYVADLLEPTVDLDVAVATSSTLALPLDFWIQPIVQAEIQVFIGGTARFSQLDVSVDPTLDRRASLDLVIRSLELMPVALDVTVGLGVFERTAGLEAHIGTTSNGPSKNPMRLQSSMDVAVLVPQPTNTSLTTPEGSVYLACRELWCGVPKPRAVAARYDVNVGGLGTRTAQLELHVQTGRTRLAWMQVFIAPEP